MANRAREKTILWLLIVTVSKGSHELSSHENKRFLLSTAVELFGSLFGYSCSNEWSDSSCSADVLFEGKCGANHYESGFCRATCGYCTRTSTHAASNLARITHPTSTPSTKTWTAKSTDSATIAPPFVHHLKTTSFVVINSETTTPQAMIDGRWGDWSPWSSCTSTCGLAIQKRTRQCDNPPPTNGGQVCHGPSDDSALCTLSPCIYT